MRTINTIDKRLKQTLVCIYVRLYVQRIIPTRASAYRMRQHDAAELAGNEKEYRMNAKPSTVIIIYPNGVDVVCRMRTTEH